MAFKVQAFRGVSTMRAPAPTRVTMTRTNFARLNIRTQRPANLQSEFLSPVAAIKGLCASFSQLVLEPVRQACRSLGMPLIEANKKKGKGCTLEGSRRKRARVSGFRTRMETVGGRKVLAARRAKGRKVLCPAAKPQRKAQKPPRRPGM